MILPSCVWLTIFEDYLADSPNALVSCSRLNRELYGLLRPQSITWARIVLGQFDFGEDQLGLHFIDEEESNLRFWNGLVVNPGQIEWIADLQKTRSAGTASIVDTIQRVTHRNKNTINASVLRSVQEGLFWRDLYFALHKLKRLRKRLEGFRFMDSFSNLTNRCYPVLLFGRDELELDEDAGTDIFDLLIKEKDFEPPTATVLESQTDMIEWYKESINHVDFWNELCDSEEDSESESPPNAQATETKRKSDNESILSSSDESEDEFWGEEMKAPYKSKTFVKGLMRCCSEPRLYLDSEEELNPPVKVLVGRVATTNVILGGFIASYWYY
ncbi:hypothetical protein HDU79_008480 [Rhizoclosmatium sp. JEL0117]|nr:hypothetical protein HDU79_008480 [Rhizoclosmatium sp. JEL0117]